jgi:hypothetical protein
MTEKEIDDILEDIEASLLLNTVLFSFRNGGRLFFVETKKLFKVLGTKGVGFFLLLLLACVQRIEILFSLILIFSLIAFGLTLLYALLQEMNKPRPLQKWEYFLAKYLNREGPLDHRTGKINDRIAYLYWTEDGPFILQCHQAARLLNVHQKENSRLIAVHSRVLELEKIQKDLEERLMQLRQLNELSTTGELGLAEVTKAKKSLTRIRYQLQKSIYNLETILLTAENELKARKLHQEINEIADVALKTAILPEPMEVLTADPLKEIEERISAEIEIYLRLETEARHYLDQVQTVTSVSK